MVRRIIIPLTIPVPERIYNSLRRLKRRSDHPTVVHHSSERDVEWPFCAAHMPLAGGTALDFGCGRNPIGFLAALRGFEVTAIDLEEVWWPFQHPRMRFVQGDLFDLDLPGQSFDLIINCSSVEHVGLVGRYGIVQNRPDGDLDAMVVLRGLMRPDGVMLLTVPVGQDTVFAPFHRVYGEKRLRSLLEGLRVKHHEYWMKDSSNRWIPASQAEALASRPSGDPADVLTFRNSLGCFVLGKPA